MNQKTKGEANTSSKSTDLGEREHNARHPHGQHVRDELGERLGEDAVRQLTGDDDGDFGRSDDRLESELGGPFVTSDGSTEYSDDDSAIPDDAEIAGAPSLTGEAPEDPEQRLLDREED